MSYILYIKDMVCIRCKMAVESVLRENGIGYESVVLGRATLEKVPGPGELTAIRAGLDRYKLALIGDRTNILVERIKTEIIKLLHSEEPLQLKLSAHLSSVLDYNYTYLANTFSDQEGITLERYFIAQRVERVKELLVYEQWSLGQIADELGYSSVSHLSLQFKKVAGLTPAEFKKLCQSDSFEWRPL